MNADVVQIIVFLVVAVFLLLRLKSVLGTKTGHENTEHSISVVAKVASQAEDVAMPRASELKVEKIALTDEELHMYVPTGSPQEKGVREILENASDFDLPEFVEGAKSAYEMLLNAFEEGDRQTLKEYVSKPVYEGFDAAIQAREAQGYTVDTKFIGVRDAKITEAEYEHDIRTASITLQFVAERTRAVRNSIGEVIEGSLTDIKRMADTWTFTRRVNSTDPNWILTATG